MIGERIERARQAAGLSLRALGERAGLSHTTVAKYEQSELPHRAGQPGSSAIP